MTNNLKSGGIVEVFPKIQIEIEEKISNYVMRFILLCTILFCIPILISLYNYFVNGNAITDNIATSGVFITGLLLIFHRLTKRWIVMVLKKIASIS